MEFCKIFSRMLLFLLLADVIFAQNSELQPSSPETLQNETENSVSPVYYVDCKKYENCRCYGNNQLFCAAYDYRNVEKMKNANITIVTPNFIPERVELEYNNFGFMKNNETLPLLASNIKTLTLYSNNITEIEDGTFDKFILLKSLNLVFNDIKNLTENVLTEKLGSTLEVLCLGSNQFLLPSSVDFTYLTNLHELELGMNRQFGQFFAKNSWIFPTSLSNLSTLGLSGCNISNIPDQLFSNLHNLTSLSLYHNPLTTYPKILNSISTLRQLDFGATSISTLNQSMLGFNQYLSNLILHDSQISSIENCAFCDFSNLTTLHLFHSLKLSFIHENAFGYANNEKSPKIESFSVELCNLTTIPEKLLNWQNVKEIGIGGNPFNCNCSMAWLIDDILNPTHSMNLKKITYYHQDTQLKCSTPLKFKGVNFAMIDANYCTDKKYHHSEVSSFSSLIFVVPILVILIFIAATLYYFLRHRKQKTLFSYAENKLNEDFDDNA